MSIEKYLQIRTLIDPHSRSRFSFKKNLPLSSSLSSSYTPCIIGSRIVCDAREAYDAVEVVTDCKWNQLVIASDNLAVVDFWAPQCEPCPIVAELVEEYEGRVEFYKMNIDDYSNISKQLEITSVPTAVFFKDGEEKERFCGDVSKSALKAAIEKYLVG